jgi:hypothetical protein
MGGQHVARRCAGDPRTVAKIFRKLLLKAQNATPIGVI